MPGFPRVPLAYSSSSRGTSCRAAPSSRSLPTSRKVGPNSSRLWAWGMIRSHPTTIRFTTSVEALKLRSKPTRRPRCARDSRGKRLEVMAHGSSSRSITKTRKYENTKKSRTGTLPCLGCHGPAANAAFWEWARRSQRPAQVPRPVRSFEFVVAIVGFSSRWNGRLPVPAMWLTRRGFPRSGHPTLGHPLRHGDGDHRATRGRLSERASRQTE